MHTNTVIRILLSNRVTEEDLVELHACPKGIDAARQLLPADITPENIAAARELGVAVDWLLERISYGEGYACWGYGWGYGFGEGEGEGEGEGYGDGYDDACGWGHGFGLGFILGYGDGSGDGSSR